MAERAGVCAVGTRFASWCTKTGDVRTSKALIVDRRVGLRHAYLARWTDSRLRPGDSREVTRRVPAQQHREVSHVEDFCAKNANPVRKPSPSGGRCIGVGVLRPCIEVSWKRAFCECVSTIWRGARADAVLCLGACSVASAFRHSRSYDTGGAVLLRRLTGGGDHEAHAIAGASLCFGLTRAISRRRFRRRTS